MSIFDNLKTSLNRLQNTQISPKVIAVCVVSFLVVASFGVLIVKKVVSQSPQPAADSSVSVNLNKTSTNMIKTSAQAGSDKIVNNNDKATVTASVDSKDPYAIIVERNIFKPIGAAGGNSGVPGLVQIIKPGGILPPLTITTLPGFNGGGFPGFGSRGSRGGGGAQKIAFTGIVETPDGIQALLENTATLETRYAGVGDSAFGMTVDEVTSRSVALRSNDGQSLNLRLGENKTDTPPAQANPAQQSGQGQAGAQPQAIPGQAGVQPAGVPGLPGMQFPAGTIPGQGSNRTGRRRGMGNFTMPQPQ